MKLKMPNFRLVDLFIFIWLISLTLTLTIKVRHIPDGRYSGTWSGNTLIWQDRDRLISRRTVKTAPGPGLQQRVEFEIRDEQIVEESIVPFGRR